MSLPDTIFIFALALVIFGPKKLPEIGRQIGKLVYEFRRASNEFKLQIEEELRSAEESDRQKQFAAQTSSLTAASVVSSETSSAPAAALTVHPPSTGTQVSTDSPSRAYSSVEEESTEKEAWNSRSTNADSTAYQTQDTEETVQKADLEQILDQPPTPFLESISDSDIEPAYEQTEEPNPGEFPERGLEPIRDEPHTRALAHSIEQPLEHAPEQATNHHG